ncbi:MAG: hypothetical protein ABUK16_07850 [Anaerolineales bacterium]
MTKEVKQKLTLDRPATYQIKVPGKIDVSQTDWTAGLKVTIESDGRDPPATTLSGEFDQAALHGLLRRLYSIGLPLISVLWIERGPGNQV